MNQRLMELVQLNAKNLATVLPDPPYKERAVDVPESFVGVIKQQPRYPPPPPILHRPIFNLSNRKPKSNRIEPNCVVNDAFEPDDDVSISNNQKGMQFTTC